jgi:tetratricopeptide (TPR) repeat protein
VAVFANYARAGPRESAWPVRNDTPAIKTSGPKRRSTRIVRSVPVIVSWVDRQSRTIVEETTTASINCHGFQYFSNHRPLKNTSATFQIIKDKKEDTLAPPQTHYGRIAWARKSRRLDGLHLVGAELAIPSNIWDVEDVPEDWAEFSPATAEDPFCFLAEVDRILHSARTATYYQLLGVTPDTSRSELKRLFYGLARRFHPDFHMDCPEWTPRLVALMECLTAAYKTLSDNKTRKEYDALLARGSREELSDAQKRVQGYLDKARECIAEKNFAACILWLHRAIECEPNSSSHRAMLGRCLSAIPEYRREAVEQFEKAIELDHNNLTAHLQYGELLEQLKLPGRARSHYLRILELDEKHQEARRRLVKMDLESPRSVSRPSLFARFAGRRAR